MNPIPGRIIEIYTEGSHRIGLVEFDGKRRAIYLSLVPEAQVGDDVLFHAGFATERVQLKETRSPQQQPAGGGQPAGRTNLETDHAYRLLSELDPQQLIKLIPLAVDKQYATGEIIFPSGATSLFLHLIVTADEALEAVTDERKHQDQTLARAATRWAGPPSRATGSLILSPALFALFRRSRSLATSFAPPASATQPWAMR